MTERALVAAGGGAGLRLKRGEQLHIIDVEGGQTGDLVAISADGKHDMLYAPCSIEMYRLQYGVTRYHANCYDNLCAAFRELGIEPEPLPSSLNFFMNADVAADGRLSILPPKTRVGASMTLRAEMDLLIALTSCPAATCNASGAIKPLGFEIVGA